MSHALCAMGYAQRWQSFTAERRPRGGSAAAAAAAARSALHAVSLAFAAHSSAVVANILTLRVVWPVVLDYACTDHHAVRR